MRIFDILRSHPHYGSEPVLQMAGGQAGSIVPRGGARGSGGTSSRQVCSQQIFPYKAQRQQRGFIPTVGIRDYAGDIGVHQHHTAPSPL